MEHEKKTNNPELPVDQLDSVSGGSGSKGGAAPVNKKNCNFFATGNTLKDHATTDVWWECSAYCTEFRIYHCVCHDTHHCVDRWHRFTADGNHVEW